MRVLSKLCRIVLYPISLILRIVAAFFTFLSEKCADRLHIFSSIMFVVALVAYIQYFFGWPIGYLGDKRALYLAVFGSIFAYIISPKGLPLLGIPLAEKLNELNEMIKSI